MTRYLTRREAAQAIERGAPVAQLLRYDRADHGEPATFQYLWIGGTTPRLGVPVGFEHVEDIGDGDAADVTWFPAVEGLLDGTDSSLLAFADAEAALAWCEREHAARADRWRHESMLGEEYLAARRGS